MLELIQKIKDYTEAGIILEHMYLFDEAYSMTCDTCGYFMLDTRECGLIENKQPSCGELGGQYMRVKKDFYCIKWEGL